MHRCTSLALGLAAGFVRAGAASGAALVDTGAGRTDPVGALAVYHNGVESDRQFLAGRFTVGAAFEIESVEAWINVNGEGGLTWTLYAGSNPPTLGAGIDSATELVAVQTTGWLASNAVSGTYPAGTYWLALEATPGFSATMPGEAPSPLSAYAFASTTDSYADLGTTNDNYHLGFRIHGELVPEPAAATTTLLLLAGLAARRRTRRA